MRRLPAAATGALLALLLVSDATAAELRGRMWQDGQSGPPSGATLTVVCGGTTKSVSLGANGSYSVRDLPANASCKLTLKAGAKASPAVPARTNATVFNFDAEIKILPDRLIVLPK